MLPSQKPRTPPPWRTEPGRHVAWLEGIREAPALVVGAARIGLQCVGHGLLPELPLVRQPAEQKISIKNPSSGPWRILPVVQDEMHWSGPEVLEVAANSQAEYTVTYCRCL